MRGKAGLFDADLGTVGRGEHLGAVLVLAEVATVGVANSHYIILSDHHGSVRLGVCLASAWDGLDVTAHAILEVATLTLVVDDGPAHVILVEVGDLTVRVQYLGISIGELTDNRTILGTDSVYLGTSLAEFRSEAGLRDIPVTHVLDVESVVQSECGQGSVLLEHVFTEELV